MSTPCLCLLCGRPANATSFHDNIACCVRHSREEILETFSVGYALNRLREKWARADRLRRQTREARERAKPTYVTPILIIVDDPLVEATREQQRVVQDWFTRTDIKKRKSDAN